MARLGRAQPFKPQINTWYRFFSAGGNNYSTTLTETITIVDSVLKTTTRTFSDVITMVDSVIKSTTRTLVTETITMVDTVIKFPTRVLTEVHTIVDSVTTSGSTYRRTLSEVVAIVDTLIKAPTRFLSEVVATVDSLIKTPTKNLTDATTIVDSVVKTDTRTLSDTVTIVDVFEGLRARVATLTETITMVDALVRSTTRTLVEAITMVDVFSGLRVIAKVLTEIIGFRDTTGFSIPMSDNFNDNSIDTAKWDEVDPGARLTETNQRIEIYNPHDVNYDYGANFSLISDLAINAGIATAQAYLDWTDEGVNQASSGFFLWVDTNNFAGFISRGSTSGTVGVMVRQGGSDVYLNQATGIANAKNFKVVYDIASHEVSFWYDNGTAWVQIDTTQTVDFGSSVKLCLTSQDNITYANADTVIIEDLYFVNGDYTELVPAAANHRVKIDLIRPLTDSLTIVDTIVRIPTRVITEAITMVDTVIKSTTRTLVDAIPIVDVFEGFKATVLNLTEAITMVDTVIRSTTRTLVDSLSIDDVFEGLRARIATLTETIPIVDSVIRFPGRVITEAITLADVLTTAQVKAKELLESINIRDTVTRYKNGVLAIYEYYYVATGNIYSSFVYAAKNTAYTAYKYIKKFTSYNDKYGK